MTYPEWAARHRVAAVELAAMLHNEFKAYDPQHKLSEAHAQQQVRFQVSAAGGLAWRNNVGATPAKCPDCGVKRQPIRYGLANDSKQLNENIKSSDLILAIPRTITPAMVGTKIAQFGAIETKRPGWTYTGKGQEAGQAAWLALINSVGGYARFSTGEITL